MLESDHFAFEVSDIDASIDYYTKTFDMRLILLDTDKVNHERFAFLEAAGGNLELLQALDENDLPLPAKRRGIKPPYTPHVAFKTPSMDGLVRMLEDRKAHVIKGPLCAPGVANWIYVADPDGNVIEFIEWLRPV